MIPSVGNNSPRAAQPTGTLAPLHIRSDVLAGDGVIARAGEGSSQPVSRSVLLLVVEGDNLVRANRLVTDSP